MFRLNIKTNTLYNPSKLMNSISTSNETADPHAEYSIKLTSRLKSYSDSTISSDPLTSKIHQTIIPLYTKLPAVLSSLNHLILFGPRGVGKEYQARAIISKYSASHLLAERKVIVAPDTKNEFWTNSSDIHYEIDFQHLGCRASSAWHDFFEHVREITMSKIDKKNIILIKNFHHIPSELLLIFHSYIYACDNGCSIRIIGLTESVSHLPDDLIDIFEIISYKRPSINEYKMLFKSYSPSAAKILEPVTDINVANIRRARAIINPISKEHMERNYFSVVEERITDSLIGSILVERPNIHLIREQLYQIPIQLVEVENILWLLLSRLLERGILHEEQLSLVWRWYYDYAHHHNHHYRYIYHVEQFIFRIIHMVKYGGSASE